MNREGNPTTNITRVRLADGRTLEVVRFDAAAPAESSGAASARSARHEREPRPLHVCPACACELVHPADDPQPTDEGFDLVLRCPHCERIEPGEFGDKVIGPFANELDRGEDELRRALDALARENMAEQVERFVAALAADAIVPEDF